MTDYEDIMKRCQRGATNLNDANNLLAECYGMLGMLARYQVAYMEFSEKCDWARTWESPSELGKHIADVIHSRYDQLKAENEALKQDANFRAVQSIRADFNECAAALPGPYYMDPPDGGDVSVAEQLRRMAKDAERYRWLRDSDDAAPFFSEWGIGQGDGGLFEHALDRVMRGEEPWNDIATGKEG